METKHTLGDWIVKRSASGNDFIYSSARKGAICGVAMSNEIDRNEAEANARLISAAPKQHAELLRLADELRSHTKDGIGATAETLSAWESRVIAAIAKATGEE